MAGVTVRVTSQSLQQEITQGDGSYEFSSVPQGVARVEPSFTGPYGGAITASDAVAILRHVVGVEPLDLAAEVAADVNASGTLTSLDASILLRFVVGAIPEFPAVTKCGSPWLFFPEPATVPNQQVIFPQVSTTPCTNGQIEYSPLTQAASGQNFTGILIGDANASGPVAPAVSGLTSTMRLLRAPTRVLHRKGTSFYRKPYRLASTDPIHALEASFSFEARAVRWIRVRLEPHPAGALLAQHATAGKLRLAAASAEPLPLPLTLWFEYFPQKPRGATPHLRLDAIRAE